MPAKINKIRVINPDLRSGFRIKVFLNDVDVSSNVTEVEIVIVPDKLPIVKLTVINVELDTSR